MSTTTPYDCPVCPVQALPLGTLGSVSWLRCRQCGMTFHATPGMAPPAQAAFPMALQLTLQEQAETLAAMSTRTLTPLTRSKLVCNQLSVNAYPTSSGGFVYVGIPMYDIPLETDLAALFQLAALSGIAWLKFDADAAVLDGVPVLSESEDWT